MLTIGIIEPIEELDWISPMVVQEKKTRGEIRTHIDLRKLNDVCVHDPFPTMFTNEALKNVGGQNMDSQDITISRSCQKIEVKPPST